MNLYYLLLQVQEIVSNSEAAQALTQGADAAAATADAAQKTPNNGWMTWVMLIGLFVIMWLFMIRPQRKAQKEQEKFLNSIENGTRVITAGGIYGVVVEVKENTLLIEVDKDVKIRVSKNSVQRDPSAKKN